MTGPLHRPGARDVAVLTLWAVLLATGLEFAGVAHLRLVEARLAFVPRDGAWMIPVVHLIGGGGVMMLAAIGSRLASPAAAWRALGFVAGCYVAAQPALLFLPRLGWLAGALLVAGVGSTAARVLADDPARRVRTARRPIRLAATGLATLGLALLVRGTPRADPGALPPPGWRGPNVLLVFFDTVRADHLSLYGYGRPTTPNLERLASRGATFEHAISPAPWTLPAHASAFTGRWPFELSADWTRGLDRAQPTLAEAFSDAGYRTAGFVGNSRFLGVETGIGRGFQHYEDYPRSARGAFLATALGRFLITKVRVRRLLGTEWTIASRTADQIRHGFEAWLDRGDAEGRPFFAFLNFFDAHHPYVAPPPYAGRFGGHPPRRPFRSRLAAAIDPVPVFPHTAAGLDSLIRSYDESIAYVDGELGRVLAALERRGQLANTIVVVTADHGEHLGERGLMDHGNSLYYPLLHVPLVVVWGDRIPAMRVSAPVTLRDLPATILGLVDLPGAARFVGGSWRDLWAHGGEEPAAGPVVAALTGDPHRTASQPVSRGDMAAIVVDSLLLIRDGNCQVELFDIADDPLSLTDLTEEISPTPPVTLLQQLDALAPDCD